MAAAVAIAVLILPPAITDARHNALLKVEDTRLLLGRWIEENVPPGSKIAVEGYSFLDTQGQPIDPKKIPYTMEVLPTISRHSLDYYRREGFDYLLTSSFTYGRYFASPQAHPEAVSFYQQLQAELKPVASFRPGFDNQDIPFTMDEEVTPLYSVFERERPGPTLDVYQIGQPRSYGARWLDSGIPREMRAGGRASTTVTVENSGDIAWPNQGYTPVRVAYRWIDSRGAAGLPEGRADLPREVMPGDRVSVQLDVTAPASPGDYVLELDLVQENFAWLSTRGVQTERTEVRVTPRQSASLPSGQ